MTTDKPQSTATTKTMNVMAAEKGPVVIIISVVLVGGGIYLTFAVNWILGLVVVIGGVVLIANNMSQVHQKITSAFEASCLTYGTEYKKNLSDPIRDFFLGVSETEARLLVQFRMSDSQLKQRLIDLNHILNVELAVNDLPVYKAGPIASLSAAAIGGVAFGGAGAIVGSLASSQVGHGQIGNVTLKLRANDIDEPLIEIPFLTRPIKASSLEAKARLHLAEQWTNLIEVIRFRIAQSK